MAPQIRVEQGDALQHPCDVVVVKYAQARYGVDEEVALALVNNGQDETKISPKPGGFRIVSSAGATAATLVMFAGTKQIADFGYQDIREFSKKALTDLTGHNPDVRTVAFTMHGAGNGLDEQEAFDALVAGILDAVRAGDIPAALAEVAIVERNPGRARRLTGYLAALQVADTPNSGCGSGTTASHQAQERLREVGYASAGKPAIFVAMPFSDAKADHYHYGIQRAVHAVDRLCERIDVQSFTGDVLAQIKRKIEQSEAVIADLSGANPNVYLEVGYAWGQGIPTVLITDNIGDLRFDVQGQRCLAYGSIYVLEEKLTAELRSLLSSPTVTAER